MIADGDAGGTMLDDRPIVSQASGECSPPAKVGYRRPPVHSRFKPGQSGNPSGRKKGSKNLKTLFAEILGEEVSLREGSVVRKVTKAEAILRGLIVGAMKGDPRNITALFRLAEQTGQLGEENRSVPITEIRRIIVDTGVPRSEGALGLPASRQLYRDDP